MHRSIHFIVVFMLLFLCSYNDADHVINDNSTCLSKERESLLAFKKGLTDSAGRLSSWKGENCCSWEGVMCSNHNDSGGRQHVTRIDLHSPLSDKYSWPYLTEQWCDNPSLHILDLADNNLSGRIPDCLSNLSRMVYGNSDNGDYRVLEEISEIIKGREQEYTTITSLLNIIDLSRNNFSDEIPGELMNLTGLGFLNLSMNRLISRIPANIGNMRLLEMLDLSYNNLSGEIPQSISSMTFLNRLNLSYNKLVGKIPSGSQMQTLNDSSIYEGNPLLCGLPLPKKCHGDEGATQGVNNTKDDEESKEGDENWLLFFVSMATGYIFGLSGVCFVLWVSESFRKTYFAFFRLY